jgi:hypothetical protein
MGRSYRGGGTPPAVALGRGSGTRELARPRAVHYDRRQIPDCRTTEETPMSNTDHAAIEQTIQTYFDGLYEGNAEKIASVFHESSALTWDQDGKISILPRDAWLKLLRERPSAQSKGLARDDAILMLDQSGPTTAFVKVKCQIPPRYFHDYLNLIKSDGRWVIVQKIYAVEVRQ